MRPPSRGRALRQALRRLAELVGEPPAAVGVRPERVAEAGRFRFAVEWRSSGAAAAVSSAVTKALASAQAPDPGVIPVVATPFMGEIGRRLCAQAGVSWLDLSGNAFLVAPGLRIDIDGRPNRFLSRGRPSSAFAPKSARIARWLLIHPDEPISQREIAKTTGVDEGFTSRIVKRLRADGLVERDADGRIHARDPALLLDAWWEAYDFSKHRILAGHVPARSGDALLSEVSGALDRLGVGHAATGLGAAWLLTHFAGFRIATFYVREEFDPEALATLSFREDPRGANLWIVSPADEGVFHGAGTRDGLPCVHPIQAWLDLKGHPERAREAAERLRADLGIPGSDA